MSDTVFDPMTAYKYGSFVEAAYQMYGNDKNNLRPSPAPLPDGYEIALYLNAVDHFVDDNVRVFYGFIARSVSNGSAPVEYVIALRGTEKLIEWLIDAEFLPTDFTPVPGAGHVEDGFFSVYKTLSALTPDGQEADWHAFVKNTIGGGRLVCAGHSLGAAVANLLALDVAVNDGATDLTLYALAPPKTGNADFLNMFTQRVPHSFQICNEPDLVPKLPPLYKQLPVNEEVDSKHFSQVKHRIACYHELVTYLFLLNQQSKFPLGSCAKS